jgi:hypothetical protein
MKDRERISTSLSALRRTPLTPSHRDRLIGSVLASPAPPLRARVAAVLVLVAMHAGWNQWVVVDADATAPPEHQIAVVDKEPIELLLGISLEPRRSRPTPETTLDEALRW